MKSNISSRVALIAIEVIDPFMGRSWQVSFGFHNSQLELFMPSRCCTFPTRLVSLESLAKIHQGDLAVSVSGKQLLNDCNGMLGRLESEVAGVG